MVEPNEPEAWFPTEIPSHPFVQADRRLQVTGSWQSSYDSTTSQVQLSPDGRWKDDTLRGTLSYRETFTPTARPGFECAAEKVAFTVQR